MNTSYDQSVNQKIRLGGARGYSVRAIGYRDSNPRHNVYSSVLLCRDSDDAVLTQCEARLAECVKPAIRMLLLSYDDTVFLNGLVDAAYAQRAMGQS